MTIERPMFPPSEAVVILPPIEHALVAINSNIERLNDSLRTFMAAAPEGDLRPAMERLVDDLITALDAVSGDCDLEDDEREPSLATPEQSRGAWAAGCSSDDTELDDSDWEDGGDKESSLGSIETSANAYGSSERTSSGDQTYWGLSDTSEREDEHDGTEPEEDFEPSLGSLDSNMSQRGMYLTNIDAWCANNDLEQDNSDSEPNGDDEPNDNLLAHCADALHAF